MDRPPKSICRRGRLFRGLPRKGTIKRRILALLLRPGGVTTKEAGEVGCKDLASVIECLSRDGGWDIRSFEAPPHRNHNLGRRGFPSRVYKIVGRVRPNRYKSFFDPKKYEVPD